jgi:hypothetical protein
MRSFATAAAVLGVVFVAANAHDSESTQRIEPADPAAIPEASEDLPPEVREVLLESAAPVLAAAIRESRRQALERGVNPIPPHIRAALEPYFPAQILDKAEWTTAGGISLDGMLKSWFYLDGAVTLSEVIAFSDGTKPHEDVELWAHELTHVTQYEELGIDAFALEYLRDFSVMESQASSNASRIMSSIGTR